MNNPYERVRASWVNQDKEASWYVLINGNLWLSWGGYPTGDFESDQRSTTLNVGPSYLHQPGYRFSYVGGIENWEEGTAFDIY